MDRDSKWWLRSENVWINLDQVCRVTYQPAKPATKGARHSAVRVFPAEPAKLTLTLPDPVGNLPVSGDEEIREVMALLGLEFPIAPPR